ncbi:MAG: hypothetical protein AB1Z55_08825, partial [Acidimicrobiia bacterium]
MAADQVTAEAAAPERSDRPWTGIHTAAAVAAVGGPLLAPTFDAADRSWTASPFPALAAWVVVGLVVQVGLWWVPARLGRTSPRPMSIVWATFGFFSFRPVWDWVAERDLPDGPFVAAGIGSKSSSQRQTGAMLSFSPRHTYATKSSPQRQTYAML